MVLILDKPRIMRHFLFWTSCWIILSGISMFYEQDFTIFLVKLIELPLPILSTYLFTYRILPLAFNKQYILFSGVVILFALLYSLLNRLQMQYILFPLYYGVDDKYIFNFFSWYRILLDLWELVGIIALFSSLLYYRKFMESVRNIRSLKEEKRKAELSFLKAQIHPHFLFNTLNAIYYEVLNKSDNAADLIIKLSEILRFALYEFNVARVPLSTELKLIDDYSDLMRSRYGDRLKVKTTSNASPDDSVPPMILFSLAENAFKHGVSDQSSQCYIDISIEKTTDSLVMIVTNSNDQLMSEQKDVFGAKQGIGLENTRRQLELTYGDDFELNTSSNEATFICKLTIPLQDETD